MRGHVVHRLRYSTTLSLATQASARSKQKHPATVTTPAFLRASPCRPALAKGFMQLYSFEQQKSQPLEAHAAAFATVKVRRGHGLQARCCCREDLPHQV